MAAAARFSLGAGAIAIGIAALLVAAETPSVDDLVLAAGEATTRESGPGAYMVPAPTLSTTQLETFRKGADLFNAHWKVFWFEVGEWGAGPTFNAMGCSECHLRNGRGAAVASGDGAHSLIVRLSRRGADAYGAPLPHPVYGDQFQTHGVAGVVPAEGSIDLTWIEGRVTLADGETVNLRRPMISFRELNFGRMDDDLLMSPRVPLSMVGMGLLDAVADDTIRALAERSPADGIHGHANRVWDYARKSEAVGRFGHKASQPTLRQQIAAAFSGDIGVSSDYFPEQNCPGPQQACRELMAAGRPELGHVRWDAVEFHLRTTAVPARRAANDPEVRRGEALFARSDCAACHVPELRTAEVPGLPALSRQVIHPYTDLLLHDMGDGLADNRPDFEAGGRDWRTTPLWGIGLSGTVNGVTTYLHDGRARNLAEAILWHGGEAQAAADRFRAMAKADRDALVRFLSSL